MKNIAIFASGTGTNFDKIYENIKFGFLKANISLFVTDKPNAKSLKKALDRNIPTFKFNASDYSSKLAYEQEIINQITNHDIDYIVLAGYMRILSENFVKTYKNKIINIHPSLLPSFKGKDAIKRTFESGVKYGGITIHYVDEGVDTGKIIEQGIIKIEQSDTLETYEQKVHELEYELYSKTLKNILEDN